MASEPSLFSLAGVLTRGPFGTFKELNSRYEQAQTQANNAIQMTKDCAKAAAGMVTFGIAAGRLCNVMNQLKYGTEMEQDTDNILMRVNTLLLVEGELKDVLVNVLRRIRDEATALKKDINEHYKMTHGLRTAGAVSGIASGLFMLTAALKSGAGTATRYVKWAGGLAVGNVAVEATAGIADWFTDHERRLKKLAVELDAVKDAAAAVRVQLPHVPYRKEEARNDAHQLANNLMDAARILNA